MFTALATASPCRRGDRTCRPSLRTLRSAITRAMTGSLENPATGACSNELLELKSGRSCADGVI